MHDNEEMMAVSILGGDASRKQDLETLIRKMRIVVYHLHCCNVSASVATSYCVLRDVVTMCRERTSDLKVLLVGFDTSVSVTHNICNMDLYQLK